MTNADDQPTPRLPADIAKAATQGDWLRISDVGAPAGPATSFQQSETVLPTEPEVRQLAGQPIPAVPGYEILAELGRGGMGVVYQARHLALNRVVALKMILTGVHASFDERDRFLSEARTIALIQHPNIVQIYDVGEHHGLPYCALELVDGGGLDKQIYGQPQPPGQAARLVATLARAVQAAHDKGIVHRDLKPANILISFSREPAAGAEAADAGGSTLNKFIPKISDFGLAKQVAAQGRTASGSVLGTPSYMAPEQAEGKTREVGPAADIYALGVILYELLTGRVPFIGVTMMDVLWQVQSLEPVAPRRLVPTVPRDLETVCLKCQHKEPAKRYGSAAALADDLERYLRGEPIAARPVGKWERTWRWCRRNPLPAGLAAAVVLITLASLAAVTRLWIHAEEKRADAEANATEADRQQKRADQQRQRAEASYRVAREALADVMKLQKDDRFQHGPLENVKRTLQQAEATFFEKFLTLRGDDEVFQAERAHALFRLGELSQALVSLPAAAKQIDLAVTAYGDLVRTHPENPVYVLDLARAHIMLANLQDDIGQPQLAMTEYDNAQRHLERLLAADPKRPDARHELARLWWNRSICLADRLHQPQDGLALCERSREAYVHLVAEFPNNTTYRLFFAHACQALGNMRRGAELFTEALPVLEEAARHFEQLAASDPNNRTFARDIAHTRQMIGLVYLQTKDPKRGREHLEQACALFDQLAARFPEFIEAPIHQADCRINLSSLFESEERWAEALDNYDRALAALESARRRDSANSKVRDRLIHVHRGRIAFLTKLGRHREVVKAMDELVAVGGQPSSMFVVQRTVALARAGIHTTAAADADRLANLQGIPADAMYNLACVYALCAAAVKDDAKTPAADAARLTEEYAARAVELLWQAFAKGFTDIERLKKDDDLKPLHDRPDFHKLLKELRP